MHTHFFMVVTAEVYGVSFRINLLLVKDKSFFIRYCFHLAIWGQALGEGRVFAETTVEKFRPLFSECHEAESPDMTRYLNLCARPANHAEWTGQSAAFNF